jgi:hypothetical protein
LLAIIISAGGNFIHLLLWLSGGGALLAIIIYAGEDFVHFLPILSRERLFVNWLPATWTPPCSRSSC